MTVKINSPTINVIAKNMYGETFYVKSLKYDPKKFKNLNDLGTCLKRLLKWPDDGSIICGYGKETQQLILIDNSIRKNGQLDWAINFDEVDLQTALNIKPSMPITVIAMCFEKAPGFGAGPDTALMIIEYLKMFLWIFGAVYYYLCPYRLLLKRYKYDETFIKDTIKRCKVWDPGFISTEKFRYKNVVEHSIMRKLGFKKIDKKWQAVKVNRWKFPHEVFKGE